MDTEKIVRRAAKEISEGQIINLGIGLPTQVLSHLPDEMDVLVHSENGILGSWKRASQNEIDPFLIDAGGAYISVRDGCSIMDSAVSFGLIRRGKLDVTMIGAFEVDQKGGLANWKIPGYFSPGIGGAMELAQKTKRVIVLCSHNSKDGKSKILKKCRLPLTAAHCVSRIITDKAVMDVTAGGLLLRELAENIELEEVIASTEADLIVPSLIERF
ncbi:3-oxoacid CoA-transferase subunit B [Emcibacter sp.]|uniref:3-oxoacid CoA-transferase subunit B n=1 Tax=Emcibacter sp. TaxID=1979954 RepID=UPI002AA78C70|nr:3-oxoacid CoA-transferase subunit B [Emcibacter sp.]